MKLIKILILFTCAFLIGCQTSENNENEPKVLENIKISYDIIVGEKITLDKVISNKTITYSTTSDLINITGATVEALKAGQASIIVHAGEEMKTITLNIKDKPLLVVTQTEYTIKELDTIEIEVSIMNGTGDISFSTNSKTIELNNNKVKGLAISDNVVIVSYEEQTIEVIIHVLFNERFKVDKNIELYVDETKDIPIEMVNGNIDDIVINSTNNAIAIIENNKIKGLSEGTCEIVLKLENQEEKILINVKRISVEITNGDISIDYFSEATLDIIYPTHTDMNLQYIIFTNGIIKLDGDKIIPIGCGETKLRVQLGDDRRISDTITITITVDPMYLIKLAHIDEVLMRATVNTFGNTQKTQSVMGGVSYYFYGDLNLVKNIIDLSSSQYVGQIATPELLETVEPLALPRTGIKLESISFITYHDTGNNEANATAINNANYMTSSDSIKNRARSWHYTVDQNQVIQSIPDDEVTWQGDAYGAYATSIGIETCVNAGSKLNVTWQRMGKLCGMLLSRYKLDISAVKQHYDWNEKNCPQTLRRNNLYSYALKMIEIEKMFNILLNNYTISFESLNTEYLNNEGQIIKNPTQLITVSYKVTVTNRSGYNESIILESKVNPLS